MGKEDSKSAGRRKWTETEARASLEEWTRSGESEFGFARRRGFSPQRLRYWRSRLVDAPTKHEPSPPAFVAVSIPAVERATPKIEIHVGALSVCVREDVDVEHLARIVGALAGVRAC